MPVQETIELSVIASADAEDTQAAEDGRTSRIMRLSPLQRLYRKGAINTDLYRVGQCLEGDLSMLLGSSAWAAVSEMVSNTRAQTIRGVSNSRLCAANRVRRCQLAVGFQEQYLTLVGLLEGFGTEELDRLWQRRRNAGASKAVCVGALGLIAEARVYETLKHQPSVWAEAAA